MKKKKLLQRPGATQPVGFPLLLGRQAVGSHISSERAEDQPTQLSGIRLSSELG